MMVERSRSPSGSENHLGKLSLKRPWIFVIEVGLLEILPVNQLSISSYNRCSSP
jgi:hypothetical protein